VTLDWAIFSPGMPHGPDTLETGSCGGSETAAILVARALSRRGHHVTLLSPGHAGGRDAAGVHYVPIENAAAFLATTPVDAIVISRDLGACGLASAEKAVVRILWCHDLTLKRQRGAMASFLWNLDFVYAPSRYHCEQIRQVHGMLPEARVRQTRNGIDLAAFDAARRDLKDAPRDPWKLVYGSRPERGLEVALGIMEESARRGLPWRLHVSSYDNTPPQLAGYYEGLYAKARSLPNVVVLGPLKQDAWRRELLTSRALIYPGPPAGPLAAFREIFAIVVAEAQAAGTPVVTCAKGAIPETLCWDAGVLLGGEETDCGTVAYRDAFLAALDTLRDDSRWQTMADAGRRHAQGLDWSGVAAQWEADVLERIAARTQSAERVRAHLKRTGDHEAAAGVEE
jgi:glycosyltransferase involved in cell wall biosynthesis